MKIICLCSKSACGKSTLIKNIKAKYSNVYEVKSYTTRQMRDDVNDCNTHVFVDENYWNKNKEKALAVYISPKGGYKNWIDINSFKEDYINLYCIDSKCVAETFYNYCVDNNIEVYVIYLDVDEEVRKERWLKREKSLKGYSDEPHLSKEFLKDTPHICVKDNSLKVAEELIGSLCQNLR